MEVDFLAFRVKDFAWTKKLESLAMLRERAGDLLFLARDLVGDLRLFLFSKSLVGLPSTCSRVRID